MDIPMLPELVAAAEDRTLGRAEFVTIRITLFCGIDGDVTLHRLHDGLQQSDHWDSLCRPFRSYHKDIVVPHATESSIPLVVLCEPFTELAKPADGEHDGALRARP